MAKTNTGLVSYAAAQLGKPYWYGTFGQTASASLYSAKKKQYPKYYTASDFQPQYGKRVHDCVGLIKGYLWSDSPTSVPKYSAAQDVSADKMLKKCTESGSISTLPELPGVLVFMSRHVGVYIGGGYVIEARGHAYGVVKTKLTGRGWTRWGKCPWITYASADKSSISEVKPASFKVGDIVAISPSATRYYPGGAAIPSWVKNDYYHVVTQTENGCKTVTKCGKPCVLLGKKIRKGTKAQTTGINTWVAVDILAAVN